MNQQQRYGMAMALVILALDQLSKHWLLGYVNSPGYSQELLPFLNLVMVWNRGISFGMLTGTGANSPFILIALTGLLCLGIACWLWVAATRYAAVALGLVLGGAMGNIIDRVRFGAVADFFDVHAFGYHWPAFNVADSAIVVGVAILVLESIFCKSTPRPSVQEPE